MKTELQFIAKKAWHENGMICISLEDEREIRFPVYKNARRKNDSVSALNNIEIICNGTGLHWPDLDEDLSVSPETISDFGFAINDIGFLRGFLEYYNN